MQYVRSVNKNRTPNHYQRIMVSKGTCPCRPSKGRGIRCELKAKDKEDKNGRKEKPRPATVNQQTNDAPLRSRLRYIAA